MNTITSTMKRGELMGTKCQTEVNIIARVEDGVPWELY